MRTKGWGQAAHHSIKPAYEWAAITAWLLPTAVAGVRLPPPLEENLPPLIFLKSQESPVALQKMRHAKTLLKNSSVFEETFHVKELELSTISIKYRLIINFQVPAPTS